MRSIGVLIVMMVGLALAGCGAKVVDGNKLVERNGLKYEVNSEKPFTGKIISYYENGQKEEEGEYHKGKLVGKWTGWYKNGQKQGEGKYRDGEKEGKWIYWYSNGQREREYVCRNGKLVGKYTTWRENGQMEKESEYQDGVEISWRYD